MKSIAMRKLISFCLIMVIMSAGTSGYWQNAFAGETALVKSVKATKTAVHSGAFIKSDTKSRDKQDTDDDDVCGPCRYCGCHAPLITKPFQILCPLHYERIITNLEAFKVLPEVYLSIFIPPQNLARLVLMRAQALQR